MVKHGNNGEFLAANWLMEELGLAAGPYDVQMVAQVIAYAARDSQTDTEAASKVLLASAKAAIESGENVNVFWFKDRKFLQPRQTTSPITQSAAEEYQRSADETDRANAESTARWAAEHPSERVAKAAL